MWDEVREQLQILQSMDKGLELFGAESHRYQLNPVVEAMEINDIEQLLGTSLPTALKDFYTILGNGGAGPDYGLLPYKQLTGYQPEKPYQGVEYFRKIAEANGDIYEGGYFEAEHEEIQGLITIIHSGCGHETCLISEGPNIGKVVYLSCDGCINDSEKDLWHLYTDWLNDSICLFKEVKRLIDMTELSMDEIDLQLQANFKCYGGRDLAISLIGVEKPKALFGSGTYRRYHGATQFPWYEKQLASYRNKGCSLKKEWWRFWH